MTERRNVRLSMLEIKGLRLCALEGSDNCFLGADLSAAAEKAIMKLWRIEKGITKRRAVVEDAAFSEAWMDLSQTVDQIEQRFGLAKRTGYSVARRLNLPPRSPMLKQAGLPPYGRRKAKVA